MPSEQEMRKERKRVAEVQQLLYAVISQSQAHAGFHDETIRMMLSDAWDELRMKPTALSPQDLEQLDTEITRFMARKAFSENRAERYQKMLLNPFFARVDFAEDGEKPETIVIGLYSLKTPDGTLLVHDWRAPVCSLYYDAMPGRAGYDSPSGRIEGVLTLKRQYAMENGRLKYFVDTEYSIDDAMLLDILSGATSNHMRQIVATIQKEQNDAIRCDHARVLCVVGCAGSGKTSVALHRAAYLMYRHRDRLSAQRIAVLSPGSAFTEYIARVLPDLGEENIAARTLHEIFSDVLGCRVETPAAQNEALLAQGGEARRSGVAYKASNDYVELLERFTESFARSGPAFADVTLGSQTLATSHEMTRMFSVEFRSLNPAQRLTRIQALLDAKLADWETSLYQQYEKQFIGTYRGKELDFITRMTVAKRLHPVRAQLKKLLAISPLELYARAMRFAPIAVRGDALEASQTGLLRWDDAPGAAYLQLCLGFAKPDGGIYQLLIDEAQDYTNISLRTLSLYFPNAHVTVLGDPNQRTRPALPVCVPEAWGAAFGMSGAPVMRLTRGYRCTRQIGEFLNGFLPPEAACDAYGRDGEAPFTGKYDKAELQARVRAWRDAGYARIAVVTRSQTEAESLARVFPGANLLTGEDDELSEKPGVTVGSHYVTKGLEFDAVAVVWPDVERNEEENRRLYTACSRALHALAVYVK